MNNIKKMLKQFWRCVDITVTDEAALLEDGFDYNKRRQEYVNPFTFFSGFHIEYEYALSETPARLVGEVWDMRQKEPVPQYFSTGYIRRFRRLQNGFAVITGIDNQRSVVYSFKMIKDNPLQLKRIAQKVALKHSQSKNESTEPETMDCVVTPWARLMMHRMKNWKEPCFAQIKTVNELSEFARTQRKRHLTTGTSLLFVLNDGEPNPPDQVVSWFCSLFARHINDFFEDQNAYGWEEFCKKFAYFSVKQIVGGQIGHESFDDLILLAECLAKDKEVFRIVTESNLSPEDYEKAEEWLSETEEIPRGFADSVMAAICALLGVIRRQSMDEKEE